MSLCYPSARVSYESTVFNSGDRFALVDGFLYWTVVLSMHTIRAVVLLALVEDFFERLGSEAKYLNHDELY